MRLSSSRALRAGLSQATRQATNTPVIARAAASTTAVPTSSNHAISNPTLANIEKRWEGMPLPEQAELWMALRDRMKENWNELTLHEKKAGESTPIHPGRAPRQLYQASTAVVGDGMASIGVSSEAWSSIGPPPSSPGSEDASWHGGRKRKIKTNPKYLKQKNQPTGLRSVLTAPAPCPLPMRARRLLWASPSVSSPAWSSSARAVCSPSRHHTP